MKVHLLASSSLPHYRKHMQPIFDLLPEELKGEIVTPSMMVPLRVGRRGDVAMVAGYTDLAPLKGLMRTIYVEHGAGQGYIGADTRLAGRPGYSTSGGTNHDGCVGYVSPSEEVARRWRRAPAVAVGCPKLDQWLDVEPAGPPSVCFAWHWNPQVCPEATSAFSHYAPFLPQIVERFEEQGFVVYGHAHPRWEHRIDKPMRAAGMELLETEEEVFTLAHSLVVDNSSLGTEFMALGRPVVWLNAPWYRREVQHGGRFWDWTEGVTTLDEPEELLLHNLWDDFHDPDLIVGRARIADQVYAYRDGSSSQRAADFVAHRVRSLS